MTTYSYEETKEKNHFILHVYHPKGKWTTEVFSSRGLAGLDDIAELVRAREQLRERAVLAEIAREKERNDRKQPGQE